MARQAGGSVRKGGGQYPLGREGKGRGSGDLKSLITGLEKHNVHIMFKDIYNKYYNKDNYVTGLTKIMGN